MLHVAFRDFNEIGDEVVAAFELDVDLGERVFETVAELDEFIVDASDPEAEHENEGKENAEGDECGDHRRGWIDGNGVTVREELLGASWN